MRGDAGIASCAHQGLPFAEGDVAAGAGLDVLLGEAEIDDVDGGFAVVASDDEIVGLDVAMQETLALDILEAGDDLDSNIEDGREAKLFLAAWLNFYQLWKRSSRELPSRSMTMKSLLSTGYEGRTFVSVVVDFGDASCVMSGCTDALEQLVKLNLVLELPVRLVLLFLSGRKRTSLTAYFYFLCMCSPGLISRYIGRSRRKIPTRSSTASGTSSAAPPPLPSRPFKL